MRKRAVSLRRLPLIIGATILLSAPAAFAASNNAPDAPVPLPASHKMQASPMTVGSAALSPAAEAQLTKRLDAMLGDTGTKVPGLGVVLYQNGQEVYSHFAGSRRFLTQNPGAAEPITRDTR